MVGIMGERVSSIKSSRRTRVDCSVQDSSFTQPKAILLVDDKNDLRITTKWFLTSFDYAVDSVRSAEDALLLFDAKTYDMVITDNAMPGMSGEELAHVIKMRSRSTPVLMYTALPPNDQSCVDLVVQRPTHLLVLKEAVEKLLQSASPKHV